MDPRTRSLALGAGVAVAVCVIAALFVPHGWPVSVVLLALGAVIAGSLIGWMARSEPQAAVLGACTGLIAGGPYVAACGVLGLCAALYAAQRSGALR